MADKKLDESLQSFRRAVEVQTSAQVIQLPLWQEAKRGTPNSFIRSALFSAIQGKDRRSLKEATLYSQQGITVKYTGEQLNQEDLTLWETLVHLARKHPLGNHCSFTAHGILKAMRLPTGGEQHRQLHSAIIRLTATAVEIIHEGKIYFGSLIKSGTKSEPTAHYTIELNRDLIRLYGESQWTAIDWEQRLALRRKSLAQALHAYYSSHRTPYPVKLATLQRLTGCKNTQAASFKRQSRTALDELVKIGFLQNYNIEDDAVTVTRVATLSRSE
ncbi:MAG: replication initiator protein A [Stenomitos rutilans HA7619-LM2]|jgi:hypothetical protein|nr:replication initiator protein A [Stenomitos rutilans HA7619-LM2]